MIEHPLMTIKTDSELNLADILHVLIKRRACFSVNIELQTGPWEVTFKAGHGHEGELNRRGYLQ